MKKGEMNHIQFAWIGSQDRDRLVAEPLNSTEEALLNMLSRRAPHDLV